MKKILKPIIIIFTALIVFMIWAWIALSSPEVYQESVSLVPSEEIHGNKVANIMNMGYVGSNENNVFIRTSNGILGVDKESFEKNVISEDPGISINVIKNNLYYLHKGNIIEINLVNRQKSKVFDNWIYSVEEIDIIGDKIFGVKGLAGGYIAYIEPKNSIKKLPNIIRPDRLLGYYNKSYYYFDSSYKDNEYMCKYDLLTHEVEGLFELTEHLASAILDSNIIYYTYQKQGLDDKEKLNTIWAYDIVTKENKKIKSFDKSYRIENIIGNKILLIDEWFSEYEAWYIYDIDTEEMITIEDERRCNSIFVADEYIVAYYGRDEGSVYKFYDGEGEYLGFEVEY